MAIEKSWPSVAPKLFTANGTQYGVVTVASTAGFKVKQKVIIVATGQPTLNTMVKRVISRTQLIVGPPPNGPGENLLTKRDNLTLYTTAAAAHIYAVEQDKVKLKPDDIIQSVYRQEPGTTIGVEIDDQFGNPIDSVVDEEGVNRLAVDANIQIENVIEVDIDALTPPDRADPDNILIVGSLDATKEGTKVAIKAFPDGSLFTRNASALVPEPHDDVVITRDPSTYVITNLEYKLLGATVANVVIERDAYLNIIRYYRA